MPGTFFRQHTDGTRVEVPLEETFAGPVPSACWLIGGGPSLNELPCGEIAASPIPTMGINLSGSRRIRPTFWTSYDPSARFHRSVYLDAGIMKFVHRRRAMDLVPETTFKVCECPNLYFFERDRERGFADFLAHGSRPDQAHGSRPDQAHGSRPVGLGRGIVDWADSMVQAIEILYRLGFRVIYLAGCEMRVRPSEGQVREAASRDVAYDPQGLLKDFVARCEEAGLSAAELDALGAGAQYHFGESKPIRAAANTDLHYFRVAQWLRLCRRSLSLAGLQLISVTPVSRLNDYFPSMPAEDVLERIRREVGNPQNEPVRGLYGEVEDRQPAGLGPMRDYRPRNWGDSHRVQPVGFDGARPVGCVEGDGEVLVEAEGFERVGGRKCER